MQTLSLELENCYGIKKLNQIFTFSPNDEKNIHNTQLIYAPNGSMKSSLANVFEAIQNKNEPSDRVFPKRTPIFNIKMEDGNDIPHEEIYVIPPFKTSSSFSETSLLLANEKLKSEFTSITENILKKKDELFKKLKTLSGISKNTEDVFATPHNKNKGDTFVRLEELNKILMEGEFHDISDISYKQIFNTKVLGFIQDPEFFSHLEDYTESYDKLVDECPYLQKDLFNYSNVNNIHKTLSENKFFDANHSINLEDKYKKNPSLRVSSQEELHQLITDELTKVMENPDLQEKFKALDESLAPNKELREFREFIGAHKNIIPLLKDLEELENILWTSYLSKEKTLLTDLLKEYEFSKSRVEELAKLAHEEESIWTEVLEIFKKRFSVPYLLSIKNKAAVIFQAIKPDIKFEFIDEDTGESAEMQESKLGEVLSLGERRSLYLLNILFEIRIRQIQNKKTLLIIDDIADSFDYKNKYAIIEYLKDTLNTNEFRAIILTHNYDFFQTVKSRLAIPDENRCFLAIKSKSGIALTSSIYYKHPFVKWKRYYNTNGKALISLIPFARNLVEYMEGMNDDEKLYEFFTSTLHIKLGISEATTVQNLIDKLRLKIKLIEHDKTTIDCSKALIPFIHEQALECKADPDQVINLENKITLSIAIRLKAEEFLIKKIMDDDWIKEQNGDQTRKLINKYKSLKPDAEVTKLLDKVNLMTPENIHVNAFMYEPLMDISDHHLISLYDDLCKLD